MVRELLLPEGGFASSQDADTDGVEGATFVWTPDQLRAALGPDDAAAAIAFYGVTDAGNFEGATILRPRGAAPAERAGSTRRCWRRAQARPQPGLDDKVIASWNGLALAALAAGRLAAGPARPDRGRRAARRRSCSAAWSTPAGAPVRTYRNGVAKIPAQLEDYAAVAFGLLELAVATGDDRYRRRAAVLADRAVELFGDPATAASSRPPATARGWWPGARSSTTTRCRGQLAAGPCAAAAGADRRRRRAGAAGDGRCGGWRSTTSQRAPHGVRPAAAGDRPVPSRHRERSPSSARPDGSG